MLFLIESIAACLLFTLMLELATAKRRESFVNDYPPVVTDKLRCMGLIAEKPPAKWSDVLRKLAALLLYGVLFALLLRHVNGIRTFWEGTLTAYGLWLVVDWYDFFVVDILLAPFDRFYRASGVHALDPSAVWFHFKGSLRGTMLGLVFAPIVGCLVTVL